MTTWCSMSRKISASYSQGHNPTESTQRKTRTDATKRPTMATIVESEQDKAAAIQLFEPSSLILTLVYLNHLHPSLISPLISQSNTLTQICPSYAGICRKKNTKETDDDMQGQKKGEPLPKAALANQSPGWCAMIWYALPFPFTQREDDDNAHPSQEKKETQCPKKLLQKVSNSGLQLRNKFLVRFEG